MDKNIIECAVFNNGFSTKYFPVLTGVRQGDPMSSNLFNLIIEILCQLIRNNKLIKGINFGKNEIKLIAFADDITCILSDFKSARHLFEILKLFGQTSGLNINVQKTEAIDLNSGIKFLHEKITELGCSYCQSVSNKNCRYLFFKKYRIDE